MAILVVGLGSRCNAERKSNIDDAENFSMTN
jgi:hypothetical protein